MIVLIIKAATVGHSGRGAMAMYHNSPMAEVRVLN